MYNEIIDICDENNTIIGQWDKAEIHEKWIRHRASHIRVYKENGEILIQHRAKEKKLYPDMRDVSAAGHVPSWEDELEGAVRELEEELGLSVSAGDLELIDIRKQPWVTLNGITNNEFYYIYFYKYTGNFENLSIQKEEVQDIKVTTIHDLLDNLQKQPEKFVPHTQGYWWFVTSELSSRICSTLVK